MLPLIEDAGRFTMRQKTGFSLADLVLVVTFLALSLGLKRLTIKESFIYCSKPQWIQSWVLNVPGMCVCILCVCDRYMFSLYIIPYGIIFKWHTFQMKDRSKFTWTHDIKTQSICIS